MDTTIMIQAMMRYYMSLILVYHRVTKVSLAETEESKQRLEDIVGYPVVAFSYPYGSRSDYTAETVQIVRESRFVCACSNFADVVWQGSDRFQLPRVLVRNWEGDEFAAQLGRWLRG